MLLLVVGAILLEAPSPAAGGGAGIKLWSNVTSADTIGIKVDLGGYPGEKCVATISKGGTSVTLRPVWTSTKGGARWSWLVAGGVGAGWWHFRVVCSGGTQIHRAHTSFSAGAGLGPGSKGLWAEGSMHARAVIQSADPAGNGGGGSGPLYPVGQCTWWVALHRPDLPLFPSKSGDALNWAKSAASLGFPVGTDPVVGAVAVFQPNQYGAGRYGHVALVTAVSGNAITISEANFRGRAKRGTRTIDANGLQFIYPKGPPPPVLSVAIDEPRPNVSVQGTVALKATSNAPAIRFEVFSYAAPSKRSSGHVVTIGEDNTPADGFSANWDTTSIPNQGGAGGSTVIVTAVALERSGNQSARANVRVNVANPRREGGQTFYPYYVVGTCDEGECGVHLHSGPGFEYPITDLKYDNEEIDVVCQSHGDNYVAPRGETSDIWDMLANGNWVTDYYVDTPERGILSSVIPRC